MATSISGKNIATTGSNHLAPGPAPAVSLAPPTPPAGPVPTPFMYISRSSSAKGTSDKLEVGGKPALNIDSEMDVEKPGNVVCNPTGGDVVTHMVNALTDMARGSTKVKANNKAVCRTMDDAWMNVVEGAKFAQTKTYLLEGAMLAALAFPGVWAGIETVFDDDLDLVLAGIFRVELRRSYHSGRSDERGPFGRGGFTHSLAQWIEPAEGGISLRRPGGQTLRVALDADGRGVHRKERLRVTSGRARYEVLALDDRMVSIFEPLHAGDDRAVLRALANGHGHRAELHYQDDRLARVDGPSGRALHFHYDGSGRVVRAEIWSQGAPRQHVDYAYGDDDTLAAVGDALGHTTRYAFDGKRRLVEKTLATGFGVHWLYDEDSGRCVRTWCDGQLLAGELSYDLEKGVTTLTGNPRARVFRWNERGSLLAEEAIDGSFARRFEYDDDGLVVKGENALGQAGELEYNDLGQITSFVDAEGRTTTVEYTEGGLAVVQVDPGGFATHYAYDSHDALCRVRYPSGIELDIEWDHRGRIGRLLGPDGIHAAFEYDEQDNNVVEIGPLGERTEYAFDALGRIIRHVDPLGRALDVVYDALGRAVEQRYPDGSVHRHEYDALDRPTRDVDPLGRAVTSSYGGAHALRSVTRQDGSVWRFEYDRLERLRKVITPRHEVWEYGYSRAGEVVEERTFDGRRLGYQFNRGEQPVRVERNDGSYRAFQYDATGRILFEENPDNEARFERDELGRVVRAVVDEPLGQTEIRAEYDALGRQVAEIQNGLALRYEWNRNSQVSARVLPDGQRTQYRYDEHGLLVEVEHEGHVVRIARDVTGVERRRTFVGPGVEVESGYDAMDRLTTQRVTRGARVLLERAYRWDGGGMLAACDDSLRGSRSYQHDALGQLVHAHGHGLDESYEYDPGGSLVGAHGVSWAVGSGNVLMLTGEAEYDYDANCRRVSKNGPEGRVEYFWDAHDRLREVRFPSGERVIYVYDVYARRVAKLFYAAEAAVTAENALELPDPSKPYRVVRYLWEGRLLAAEIDSTGGTRVYVHEPKTFSPILHCDGGVAHYYVLDQLRAASELVDGRGEIVWAPKRTAWGAVTEDAVATDTGATDTGATASTPFRLLGHYHDDETGLDYARYRYFEADTARWISPDPLLLDGGPNLAAFNGSPLCDADPLGLRCIVGDPILDKALRYVFRFPPKAGFFDVGVHGTPNSVAWKDAQGKWTDLTPAELAARLRAAGWNGTDPIRLNSCNAGRDPEGFAQQLARETGVVVEAPNRTLWAGRDGSSSVVDRAGRPDPVTGKAVKTDNPGTYVPYSPTTPAPTPAAPWWQFWR
jgi:RHS repeat-associated protein